MTTYTAEIRNNGVFHGRLQIEANNRGDAVRKAQLYFWYKYHGRLGTANQALVVDDPNNEVNYSQAFRCKDKKNILLQESVIMRLLEQAGGELIRDTRTSTPHNPRGSVRRLKRRRDFGVFIAPSIRKMKNGKLYYRINTQSQVVHNGKRYRKRKYKDIPLDARTLSEAVLEIENRKLMALNDQIKKRTIVSRDLRLVKWMTGLLTPPSRISRVFRVIMERYTRSVLAG